MRQIVNLNCLACETGTLIKHKKPAGVVWSCTEPGCQTSFANSKGRPNRLKKI